MWSKEKVKGTVLACAAQLGTDAMPGVKQLRQFCPDKGFIAALTRSRDSYYNYARLCGLHLSATHKGSRAEREIAALLQQRGYTVEAMPDRYEYDLLVNGVAQIDVKTSSFIQPPGRKNGWDTFSLHKKHPTCSFYILLSSAGRVFILPANVVYGQTQISIGRVSKYNCYLDRYDILDSYIHMMQSFGPKGPAGTAGSKGLPF